VGASIVEGDAGATISDSEEELAALGPVLDSLCDVIIGILAGVDLKKVDLAKVGNFISPLLHLAVNYKN
jgi:hypothetical protein